MTKLTSLVLLLAAACGTSLPSPTLIERDRVLGAKVTVDTDPTRAWPAPGEAATVTWLTAAPDGPASLTWSLAACAAATTAGPAMCASEPFASSQGEGSAPILQLVVPPDIATDAFVVFGAFCDGGRPQLDDDRTATCDDGARAEHVTRHVLIAFDAANHNPTLADSVFTIAGALWIPTRSTSGCIGVLPEVTASADAIVLGATLDDADRETFMASSGETRRERLELSAFTTAGELMQGQAFVDPDDTREVASVGFEWQPPAIEDIPAEGLRVQFQFVVRDRRGGVDGATRELCVVR